MAVKAQAKYVRTSPRKVGEVADLIRGKTVADARSVLVFPPRRGSAGGQGPRFGRGQRREQP